MSESRGRVEAFVGVGATLGDAAGNGHRAILQLAEIDDTTLTVQSSLFRSAPGPAAGPAAVCATPPGERRTTQGGSAETDS